MPLSSFVERLIISLRRNFFFLFVLLVFLSVLYTWYSLELIGTVNHKESSKEDTCKPEDKKKHSSRIRRHPVDNWSKYQLFKYLCEYGVYPDTDENVDTVRFRAKLIYDLKE